MRRLALLAALVVLAAAPAARTGGQQVSVASTAGRVWATDGWRVFELDAASGKLLAGVATRYPFALQLALSDGAVWAASVENGFVTLP